MVWHSPAREALDRLLAMLPSSTHLVQYLSHTARLVASSIHSIQSALHPRPRARRLRQKETGQEAR